MPVINSDIENLTNADRAETRADDLLERRTSASRSEPTPLPAAENSNRFYGVYPAVVTHVADPDGQGRIEINLPWSPDPAGSTGIEKVQGITVWARVATLMAGNDRGSWFIPEVGDEVLVSFQAGDPSHPIVIGALWNGQDTPPAHMDGNQNNTKLLKTKSGNEIRMSDTEHATSISMTTADGNSISLSDFGSGKIEISHTSGASVSLEAGKVTVNGTSQIHLSGTQINLDAPMVIASGALQCTALIAQSYVASPAYTPGAGNII